MRKFLPILSLLAGCNYPLIHEVAEADAMTLRPQLIRLDAPKEAILGALGEPASREVSAFGRETWVYPPLFLQATYSNEGEPGWYLFVADEGGPKRLVIQFDGEGHLSHLLTRSVNQHK